jgi:hypothetical protein
MRIFLALLVLLSGALPAAARDLTLATWNLGWHMSLAEARAWIAACGAPFVLNSATGLWEPAADPAAPGLKRGWDLKWGRDAKIVWDIGVRAPCDVYQANWKVVPVTEAAYAKRLGQVTAVLAGLDADVLAFQEVSGEQSVREVLPDNGAGYGFCAFSSHAVQRLVVAWKTSLGGWS